jgi:hypothetical protein
VFRQLRTSDGSNVAYQVATASPPLHEWRKFIYCESLTGDILAETDHFEVRASVYLTFGFYTVLDGAYDSHRQQFEICMYGQSVCTACV